MKSVKFHKFLTVAALCVSLPRFAHATLGGNAASVDDDRATFGVPATNPTKTTVIAGKYTILEIDIGSAKLREYLSTDDKIFGVAWKGRRHPKMENVLGVYEDEFDKAFHSTRRVLGRRGRLIKTANIVVRFFAKGMGNLKGHAYVPALLPAGVNPDEIQ